MRKCLIWALVVSLLLGCCLGAASADTGTDDSATSGVDVIVVMDMSGSMSDREDSNGRKINGNDSNAFRIDATAMLVGMLDMDGSRIGIVPFAGAVLEAGVKPLTVVNTPSRREAFIADLYDKIAKTRGDSTNTGAALMRALYMLQQREDKSNRPMIVLLTDGKNAIMNSTQGTVNPSYRWSGTEIVDQHRQVFSTEMADSVTREAVDAAKEMGIPIYTVSLTMDPYSTSSAGLSLASISEITGLRDGCLWAKTREDAKEIPGYFAKALADKIGSSVQIITAPRKVEGTEKTYEVPIPVLNESIREINVILPVKKGKVRLISGIDASSIRILNARGEFQTAGADEGVTILRSEKGSFAMIKIRKPKRGSTGMWKLQFESDTDPSAISFNFLYNYNIKLNSTVATDRGDSRYYKSDRLHLSAYFADEDGAPSEDASLYADHTDEPDFESWMTIRARWQLFEVDADGRMAEQPVRSGKLQPQETPLRFAGDIDLSADTPKSGTYKLICTAEGAGLVRTVELPITLENHAPVAEEYTDQINVNSPFSGGETTWTSAGTSGTLRLKAGEIVTDADPEDQANMVFSLVEESGEAGTVTKDRDGTLRFTTKEEDGRVKDGEIVYLLKYDDGDAGGSGEVRIRITVFDIGKDLVRTYEPEMEVTGTPAVDPADDRPFGSDEYTYKKNTQMKVTVRLKSEADGTYANEELLTILGNEISITDSVTEEPVVRSAPFVLNGDTLEYTVESTGNKKAVWTVAAKVGPFEGEALTREVTIPNNYEPVAETAEEAVFNCSGEKVPGFLHAVIGEDTPGEIVKVGSLFSDKDNDSLVYSDPVFKSPEGEKMDPADIKAVLQEEGESPEYLIEVTGQQTSVFKYKYRCTMEITATDGDGQQATYERAITVVDLYNKMLTYVILALAAIIALVILFLIIHQIRKPRFPQLNLTIREEPSLYESGSDTLSPVKTPTNVNAMGVDGDMAAKHGIAMELLQNIIIKPIRSTLAVGVVCRKSFPGQEVTLDDVRLKPKKQYTWKIEQELCIHNDRSESMIVIKLENRGSDEPEDVLDDFGGSDDWSDDGAGMNMSKAGRKRSKKVERKAKPAAPDNSASGSTDDFDF